MAKCATHAAGSSRHQRSTEILTIISQTQQHSYDALQREWSYLNSFTGSSITLAASSIFETRVLGPYCVLHSIHDQTPHHVKEFRYDGHSRMANQKIPRSAQGKIEGYRKTTHQLLIERPAVVSSRADHTISRVDGSLPAKALCPKWEHSHPAKHRKNHTAVAQESAAT